MQEDEIKAVLFDLDNTLCDFVEAKICACRAVTEHLDRTDDLLSYFTRGKYDIEDTENIRDYLDDRNLYGQELYGECACIYRDVKVESISIYPGVKRTLETLREKGMTIGIITDAFRENAVERLNKLGIGGYVDLLITCDVTGMKKKEGQPFRYALEVLELSPKEVVLVGDSNERDLNPAMEVGLYTVYAKYGDRNRPNNSEMKYHAVIHSPEELLEVLGFA